MFDLLSSLFLPAAHSTYAASVDWLFNILVVLSVVLFVLITGTAAYWVAKYKRKAGDEKNLSTPTLHLVALEVFWSVGPLLVCIGLFHIGTRQYMDARVAPSDAYVINVKGQKWLWEFTYPNGRTSSSGKLENGKLQDPKSSGLHVPVNRPIKLVMTSKDVIHSFFVPVFRVKQDVLPGRYSTVWFEANQIGEDMIFCTEYCGMGHSDMLTKVYVESENDFKAWVDFDPYKGLAPVAVGEKIYSDKACMTCHSLDGSPKPGGGPSFKGLWGKQETLADGSTVTVDEKYIRESVLVPGAKIVKGFQPVMPSFQGSLKEDHIAGIIEFIKAQK